MEMLTHAISPDGDTAVVHHRFPKEPRRTVPVLAALQIGYTLESDHFGYLCIGMLARELVPFRHERFKDSPV